MSAAATSLTPQVRRALGAAHDRWAARPAWGQVLAVYLAARFVTWLVTERTARFQTRSVWSDANPGYLDFVDMWDGDWYRKIAETGYPLPLPADESGMPYQSEWAFFPAYPLLVRTLMTLSGQDFELVAPTTSLVLGAAAVVVMYRVFRLRTGHGTALGAVALFSAFPTSPVLQYAYTESLALLGLTVATYLLITRRYLWCLVPVVLLGLTRPVGAPFGLVVLAHLVHRWRRRRDDPLPATQAAAVVLLGLVTAGASLAWPLWTGWATGEPDAYTRVQGAWHGGSLEWVAPWWRMSQYLLGDWFGPLVLLAAVAAYTALLLGPGRRALGVEMTAWCGAYALYLIVVLQPFTSLFRYLLLLFPLALLVARTVRSRAHLLTWLAALVSLQVVWVAWLWRFSPPSDVPP